MITQRDIFVCHASEEKASVVRPLVDKLLESGISYWYDEAEIRWGDSITDKINEGLRISRFIIVVLSQAFINKPWPQRELNAILNVEASTGEVCILPLIVGTPEEHREILARFPLLNDKLYLTWDGITDDIIKALKSRLASSISHQSLSSPIIGLCPADVSHIFKDRVSEIEVLRQALKSPDYRLVCIIGRGGLGKTALLSKLCMEIEGGITRLSESATDIGVDGMIYMSCREIDRPNLERIFFAIGHMLDDEEGISRLWNDISLSVPARIRELLHRLQGSKCYLLVLDNAEDILNDDGQIIDHDLRTFVEISVGTPHALRIIATSRKPITVYNKGGLGACRVNLDLGLPDSEAIQHLRDLDQDGTAGLRDASRELLLRVAQQCMGVPRALELMYGFLVRNPHLTLDEVLGDPELFRKLEHQGFDANRTESLVENLIAASYHQGDSLHRRLIEILAVFGAPVPIEAITHVAKAIGVYTVIKPILDDLVRTHTVTFRRTQHTYELHPIDQAYAYAQIPCDSELGRPYWHKIAAAYYQTQELPKDKWKSISDVQPQLCQVHHLLAAEAWDDAARVLNQIDFHYLRPWGYASLRLEMREKLKGKVTGCFESFYNLNQLGLAYYASCLHYPALQCYEEIISHVKVNDSLEVLKCLAAALLNKGLIEREAGRFEQSCAHFEQVKELHQRLINRFDNSLGSIGINRVRMGDFAGATDCLERSIEASKAPGLDIRVASERIGLHLVALGEACMLQGDYAGAIIRAKDGMQFSESVPHMQGMSLALSLLGTTHLATGQISESRKALEKQEALGRPKHRPLCSLMIGITELADGHHASAEQRFSQAIESSRLLLDLTDDLYEQHYVKALALLAAKQTQQAKHAYNLALERTSARGVLLEALLRLSLLEQATAQHPGIDEVRNLLTAALPDITLQA